MRMTQLFGRTLREPPSDAEGAGYRLLQRAGYVRDLGANKYAYLPAGQRAVARLAAELAPAQGEAGRCDLECPPFEDTADLLALTRTLAASDVQSYRHLPVRGAGRNVWRHALSQSRGGPLNAREAPACFVLHLDAGAAPAEAAYAAQQRAFLDLCVRCGLAVMLVRDQTAAAASHAYLYPSDDGIETALVCDGCGYVALAAAAASGRLPGPPEDLLPLEKIATPHTSTIADLARLLGVPESRTAKAVFLVAAAEEGERFVFAVVRGDTGVSEHKLRAALRRLEVRAGTLRPATEAEIRATGATPGYASPVGLRNVLVVVDQLAARSPNLVAGANEEGYHLLNTNVGRDYRASLVADIAAAEPGDGCPVCSDALRSVRMALLGRSAAAGHEKGGPQFLDTTGRAQPVQMSAHCFDLGALLAAIAAGRSDEGGMALPPAAAPFAVHLVSMPGAESEVEALYRGLWAAGMPCLLDDRSESAGVKFTDADLIGLPLRITLGKRSLQAGGAEFKRRERGGMGGEKWIAPLDTAVDAAAAALAEVEANAIAGVKELPHGEHLR